MAKKLSIKKRAPETKNSNRAKGILFILLGLVSLTVFGAFMLKQITSCERLQRINSIYSSLNLDSGFRPVSSNIFGEKKVYEWDGSRTYASSVVYYYGANVDTTAATLKKKIEAAGFKYFEEPYPGSTFVEWHFKSDKNEYIRLVVSSKPRDDAISYANLMKQDDSAAIAMNSNQGPSVVTIKVNLDDNNE